MKSFFPQLVAEVSNDAKKRNEVTAPILSNDVDRLLSAFRDKTAPMVPRADILAEAHREYLKVGEVKKAQQLLDDMEAVYGVHPLSVSFERQANAYVVLKNDPYQAYRVLKSVRRVTSGMQSSYMRRLTS
jgi:prephenate dehydrogenase